MTAHRLIGLYDQLAVWERIPLLLSAQARKDDVEYVRLFDASPIRSWKFAGHLLAEQALHIQALEYITQQLDLAGTYFFGLFKLLTADPPGDPQLALIVNASAYLFKVRHQAWQRFCDELKIPATALVAGNQEGWFLSYCEEHMPEPPVDELLDQLRDSGIEMPKLVTVETILANWKASLKSMTRHAPPPQGEP